MEWTVGFALAYAVCAVISLNKRVNTLERELTQSKKEDVKLDQRINRVYEYIEKKD